MGESGGPIENLQIEPPIIGIGNLRERKTLQRGEFELNKNWAGVVVQIGNSDITPPFLVMRDGTVFCPTGFGYIENEKSNFDSHFLKVERPSSLPILDKKTKEDFFWKIRKMSFT